MTFSSQTESDLGEFFNTNEFAESALYNGSEVDIVVLRRGQDEDSNSIFDVLEVEMKLSDVSTLTYSVDSLVYDSLTWKYPRLMEISDLTLKVRFIRNQRPRIGK